MPARAESELISLTVRAARRDDVTAHMLNAEARFSVTFLTRLHKAQAVVFHFSQFNVEPHTRSSFNVCKREKSFHPVYISADFESGSKSRAHTEVSRLDRAALQHQTAF